MPAPRTESRQILAEHEEGAYGATTPGDEDRDLNVAKDLPQLRKPLWPLQRRHYVALMAFLGFFNIYALRANLSIAIIDMTSSRSVFLNGSVVVIAPEFKDWDSVTRGVILASFFYGYILTQIPGGWAAAKYGGARVFAGGVFVTGILTLLTPPMAHFGAPMLIVIRFVEGLAEGVTYPSIHAVWRYWAPPMEKTRLATIAFAGSYFGNAVSMPLSAWLGDQFGWPSIFYVFGLLSLAWTALWWKSVANSPGEDRKILPEELNFIQSSIGYTKEQVQTAVCRNNRRAMMDGDRTKELRQSADLKPPWKEMAGSKAVWAIIAAHFAENWGFYTMLTYLPTFVHKFLGFEMEETGLVSALPYLTMGITVIVGGQAADYMREKLLWDTGRVRKLFVVFAFGGQALFLLLFSHILVSWLAVINVTIAVGVGGLAWAGFSVNHLDIAPQYASLLMGISNTVATLPGMLSPVIVGAIVSDERSVWEWRCVFYIVVIIYALGAGAYFTLSSGKLQPWAQIPGGYVAPLHEDSVSVEDGRRDQ